MRNMTGLKRGGSGGRPKGSPNKATVEIKSFCRNLLSDKAYVTSLRKRLLAGKLAPAFEVMLFAYAYGKPKEPVEVNVAEEISRMSDEDLRTEARRLLKASDVWMAR